MNLARRACGAGTDSHAGQIKRHDHRFGTALANGKAGCVAEPVCPGPEQHGVIAL